MMKMSPINMSNFCGVHWVCKYTPNREDRYCKRHKYLETKLLQEELDECAENLFFLSPTCELCNERDHFSTNANCFMIVSCPKIVMT